VLIGIVIVKGILTSRSFKDWFGEFQVSGMRVVSVFRHGFNMPKFAIKDTSI